MGSCWSGPQQWIGQIHPQVVAAQPWLCNFVPWVIATNFRRSFIRLFPRRKASATLELGCTWLPCDAGELTQSCAPRTDSCSNHPRLSCHSPAKILADTVLLSLTKVLTRCNNRLFNIRRSNTQANRRTLFAISDNSSMFFATFSFFIEFYFAWQQERCTGCCRLWFARPEGIGQSSPVQLRVESVALVHHLHAPSVGYVDPSSQRHEISNSINNGPDESKFS